MLAILFVIFMVVVFGAMLIAGPLKGHPANRMR